MAFRQPGEADRGQRGNARAGGERRLAVALLTVVPRLSPHVRGNVNQFSKHPSGTRLWKILTPLNARHMQIAWASLTFVALTDLYVRLVASGAFPDPKIF